MDKQSEPIPLQPKHQFSKSFINGFLIIVMIACVMATLFTAFTTNTSPVKSENNQNTKQPLNSSAENQPTKMDVSPSLKVSILAGHYGYDSGTVCSDGLQEVDITLQVATIVQKILEEKGYRIDLLKENDLQLPGYQATVLVSIHIDSCDFINNEATGFKVAVSTTNPYPERPARLAACLRNRYMQSTGLPIHSQSVTPDMTDYHVFREINENTTSAIIEIGFLNLDREILTTKQDLIADGIIKGILCFINNENIPLPTQEINP